MALLWLFCAFVAILPLGECDSQRLTAKCGRSDDPCAIKLELPQSEIYEQDVSVLTQDIQATKGLLNNIAQSF